ncbi:MULTISPECIES: KOW domain-containing RNA-binding protein [unclassified Ruminococcus]|uniref:KOW domain-containing RNA-binding protein n=1 Tax=unclassified Ruminococcus TaxID=2608920 RepID=UPI00210AB2C3|nr:MULTISPECIES: KOW domain-containing RNA-binding protein [unclassified Ruminococcus]MCQ4023057.1 hypothetical protein [Ruminococcus sp. zg-924]MCQ4115494.1 hypothetical protein [Ruminococcus sp. zg-921]
MDIQRGLVVRAKSGRDKNRFFVVICCDGEYAYIADGKTRRLEKPKRKNVKHLFVTNTVIPVDSINTDKLIKSQLRDFNV